MAFLELKGITKRFGGVTALSGVDFSVEPGEVMALVGDNGAGKSTLVKVIAGAHPPDAGSIHIRDRQRQFRSPQDAWAAGVATIYQELALAGKMNVADNVYLGQELRKKVLGMPFLDRKTMRERTRELLDSLEVRIQDIDATVEYMSGGQRQGIAIARALNLDAELIIMDEPTAALAVAEQRKVLDFIRRLRDSGKAVILVSHNIQDVFEVSDRITVLRRGELEAVGVTSQSSPEEVIGWITGASRIDFSHRETAGA